MFKFGYVIGRMVALFADGYGKGRSSLICDKRLLEVEQLLRADPNANMIPAIKLHREHFISSLLEAKNACEAIRARLGYVPPSSY